MPPKSTRSSRNKTKGSSREDPKESIEPRLKKTVIKEEVPEEPSLKTVSCQTEDEVVSKKLYDYKTKTLQDKIKKLESRNVENVDVSSKKLYDSKVKSLEDRIKKLEKENETLRNQQIRDQYSKVSPALSLKSLSAKGCNCKGNCANKVCGCVKRGHSCSEFCKCNDATCRNQEPTDKENNKPSQFLTKDEENALSGFSYLTITQSAGKTTPNNTLHKKATDSVTKRQLFSQDSNELIDIGSADNTVDKGIISEKSPSPKVSKLKVSSEMDVSFITVRHNKIDQQPVLGLGDLKRSSNVSKKNSSHLEEDSKKSSSHLEEDSKKNLSHLEEDSKKNLSHLDEDSKDFLNESLNPMVPRHQLKRSPINKSYSIPNAGEFQDQWNSSQSQQPARRVTEDLPAEVDLEEFNRNLVTCKKCYRRFRNDRIEHHQSVCKRT